MRSIFLYILSLLISFFISIEMKGQAIDSLRNYCFEGDEVVFQFDVRQYFPKEEGLEGTLDFEDFKIDEVILSGSIDDWNQDDWKMKKVSKFIYQLRKPINDFNDRFWGDFKFLVNKTLWIKPQEDDFGTLRKESDPFWEGIFDIKMNDVVIDPNGNTRFYLEGWTNTKEIILTGDFVGWDEHQLKMNKTPDGWSCKINLPPGRYEYKFIADGKWLHDPANDHKIKNEHDTYNSILEITQKVVFQLKGYPDAKKVELAGTFNKWQSRPHWYMKKENGVWYYTAHLLGGKHFYKFIVDETWMTDPTNTLMEHDHNGNVNSVLFVR